MVSFEIENYEGVIRKFLNRLISINLVFFWNNIKEFK